MRLLSRVAIALIICLAAMALPAGPVQANGAHITLSPSSGVPGEKVTVRGYNFTADDEFYVYYYQNSGRVRVVEVETDDDGYFKDSFVVPESYTGDHEVYAEDEHDIDAYADFTVEPGLTVDHEEGPVGTNVTVEGHGFAEDEEDIELMYYLNGDPEVVADNIDADEDGWWQRSFEIPDSAKGSHDIDAEGDESRLYEVEGVSFEVIPWINILDEPLGSVVDEPSGSVGDSITMTGSGFYDEDTYIKILFAGEEAETEPEIIRANENGYWEASFEVPEMAAGEYSVTAEGQYTKDVTALTFEIKPGIVLSHDEGHVGTNLTVTGGGFATNKNVVIKYDGSEVKTARSDHEGSFSGVTFSVPESPHGEHQVTAEVDGKVEATANFTVESDAPETPEPTSPPDGDRVGFIGTVRPTFEWSEVSDESGVRYSLQIAASVSVTATGEFVDPIFSVEGLVGTNYTLNSTEARPYGTYYWIVKAIDGAENESGWSEAYSFQAGVMPLWAFIVIIVAVAAAIGAAVYFFVIRKRVYYY